MYDFPKFDIYKNNVFFLICQYFLYLFEVPGLKNPEIMEFGGFGPSHDKTELLLDQNEAESSPGACKSII